MQGSVQNVARRLGKCRSYRRMQIHCMVLIVVSRYVSPAKACYGAVCAECALAGAVSVHLHLIIPSPHSGLQLSVKAIAMTRIPRSVEVWVPPPLRYNNIMS